MLGAKKQSKQITLIRSTCSGFLGVECHAPSQARPQLEVKHLRTSYFSRTSPFIVVSGQCKQVCTGAPEAWRSDWEQLFSLKSFQARRHDTAGPLGAQQKTVAGGHGRQGAGEELRLFVFEGFMVRRAGTLVCTSQVPSFSEEPWPHRALADDL